MKRDEARAINQLASQVVDSAVSVHRELGPGLMESTYQACLSYELGQRGLEVRRELVLPIHYREHIVRSAYRIDMLVEGKLLVENKAVAALLPLHVAQLLTYLRLSGRTLGLLINWNTVLIRNGIKRVSNGHPEVSR